MKQKLSFAIFLLLTIFSCANKKTKQQTLQTKPPFEKIKSQIPIPVYEKNSGFVELYWKAWKLAYDHVRFQKGLIQSPYIDEALWDDTIWIWDTEFMVLFCKYAREAYPGIQSLNNFYGSILDKKPSPLKIQHPDNPPFFAWIEAEYYKFSDDRKHLEELITKNKYLQRHFEWFDNLKPGTKLHFKHAHIAINKKEKGYNWDGVQSGLDNTPRGRKDRTDLLWIDAIAQQALAAKNIVDLSLIISNKHQADLYQKKYDELKNLVNKYYWDEKDGFYYDIRESNGEFVKVKTPASYWVLLAEIASPQQAKRMATHADNEKVMGGKLPWPTVSRDDKTFNAKYGDYWRGAIWLPTAYMATKSLEKYGFNDLADKNAENLLVHMLETYKKYKPATIWECYNPTKPEPSHRVFGEKIEEVRPDFCGWSALGPISLFIENVIGFHQIDAQKKLVKWRLDITNGKQGIKNLSFGKTITDIVFENGKVNVKSNKAYTLEINKKLYQVKKGQTVIEL
jgi:glycogen debranching enzyme